MFGHKRSSLFTVDNILQIHVFHLYILSQKFNLIFQSSSTDRIIRILERLARFKF